MNLNEDFWKAIYKIHGHLWLQMEHIPLGDLTLHTFTEQGGPRSAVWEGDGWAGEVTTEQNPGPMLPAGIWLPALTAWHQNLF